MKIRLQIHQSGSSVSNAMTLRRCSRSRLPG
jgi:hypothetical protein